MGPFAREGLACPLPVDGGPYLPENEILLKPVRPKLQFMLGPLLAGEFQLPGGTLEDGNMRGWADEISRSGDPGSPEVGTRKPNGVDDWVEMRAWKYFLHPRPMTAALPIPTLGDSFPDDPFLRQAASVVVGESAEVLRSVAFVKSDYGPFVDGNFISGLVGKTDPCPGSVCPFTFGDPPSATNQFVLPVVTIYVYEPHMRTDQESTDEDSPTLTDNEIVWLPLNEFWQTAVHEARHAWQFSLLVRSPGAGSGTQQFLPPFITVVNDEGADDFFPDNNDDQDCLPEAAFLVDPTVPTSIANLGIPGGSAYTILDTAGRAVSKADGTSLGTIGGDGVYDGPPFEFLPLGCNAAASAMRERDAVRFSRGIESLRRAGPPP